MGLLSDAMGKIGGLLGTEIQGVPIGNFLGIPTDQRQMAIMLATGGDPEKLRQLEMDRMRQEVLQRQMDAMEKQQGREDITAAMMQANSNWVSYLVNQLRDSIQSGDEAGAQKAREGLQRLQSPENQLLLRSHIAGHGDMDMALQGGLVAPMQQEENTAKMREYEFARQNGYTGSFIDYLQLGAGGQASLFAPTMVQNSDGTWSAVQFGNTRGMPPVISPLGGVPSSSPEVAGQKALQVGRGTAVGQAAGKAEVAAPQSAMTIEEIESITSDGGLIDQSTGSGVGAIGDATAAFFGKTTAGAEAIARLRPIAHRLLMNVPRFEGPQSQMDVQAYQEAAGKIADPFVPAEIRKAAALEIARLMRKASSTEASIVPNSSSAQQPTSSGPRRRGVWNAQTGRIEYQ